MAFRREKYVPFGGPSGGDGGTGGDIILSSAKLNNLSYYHRNIHFKAGDGQRGGQNRMTEPMAKHCGSKYRRER